MTWMSLTSGSRYFGLLAYTVESLFLLLHSSSLRSKLCCVDNIRTHQPYICSRLCSESAKPTESASMREGKWRAMCPRLLGRPGVTWLERSRWNKWKSSWDLVFKVTLFCNGWILVAKKWHKYPTERPRAASRKALFSKPIPASPKTTTVQTHHIHFAICPLRFVRKDYYAFWTRLLF